MRHSHWRHFLAALTVVAVANSPALAQARRPMTMVDLLNTPNLSDPQLSPDGRQLVYVLGEADWTANRRVAHIWRIDVGLGQRQAAHQRARQRGQPAMVARRKADRVYRAAQRLSADST